MGSNASTSGSGGDGDGGVIIYTPKDDDKKSGRTLDVKPDWNNTSILPPVYSPMEFGVGHHS